jgi:hypothetical protein
LTAHDNTDELRRELEARYIPYESKGETVTRWMNKGRVWIADVQEPSGEVILTSYPNTLKDVL